MSKSEGGCYYLHPLGPQGWCRWSPKPQSPHPPRSPPPREKSSPSSSFCPPPYTHPEQSGLNPHSFRSNLGFPGARQTTDHPPGASLLESSNKLFPPGGGFIQHALTPTGGKQVFQSWRQFSSAVRSTVGANWSHQERSRCSSALKFVRFLDWR